MPTPTLPWAKLPIDAETGLYKTAEIKYQVDAGRLSQPVSIARVEGQKVSYDEIVSRPKAGCAVGSLTIRYPHPDGRAELAQARLVIQSDSRPAVDILKPSSWRMTPSSADADSCYEDWRFDLSKADLDRLIDALRRDGCFTEDLPQAKASQLTLGFDGRRIRKPWSQSPPLEAMMQRVRLEGQLVSMRRPAAPANKVSITSSLDSYRNLVAQGGGGDSPQAMSLAMNGLIMPHDVPIPGPGAPRGSLPGAAPSPTELARGPSAMSH